MELIESLEHDHEAILGCIDRVVSPDGRLRPDGRERLMQAHAMLMEHLRREDADVYPRLREAAVSDHSLRQMLEASDLSMKMVSSFTVGFFDEYRRTPERVGFQSHLMSMRGMLQRRIQFEEERIFPAYVRLCSAAPAPAEA